MSPSDKRLRWLGTSEKDYMAFPEGVKDEGGHNLRRVQQGLTPKDFKPMSDVGAGVHEIRITTKQAHRIFYIASFSEAVYVLHVFEKKTQKTDKSDIELGAKRLSDLIKARKK